MIHSNTTLMQNLNHTNPNSTHTQYNTSLTCFPVNINIQNIQMFYFIKTQLCHKVEMKPCVFDSLCTSSSGQQSHTAGPGGPTLIGQEDWSCLTCEEHLVEIHANTESLCQWLLIKHIYQGKGVHVDAATLLKLGACVILINLKLIMQVSFMYL